MSSAPRLPVRTWRPRQTRDTAEGREGSSWLQAPRWGQGTAPGDPTRMPAAQPPPPACSLEGGSAAAVLTQRGDEPGEDLFRKESLTPERRVRGAACAAHVQGERRCPQAGGTERASRGGGPRRPAILDVSWGCRGPREVRPRPGARSIGIPPAHLRVPVRVCPHTLMCVHTCPARAFLQKGGGRRGRHVHLWGGRGGRWPVQQVLR